MPFADVEVFDPKRIYDDSDPELNVIARKSKRAQWRHRLQRLLVELGDKVRDIRSV